MREDWGITAVLIFTLAILCFFVYMRFSLPVNPLLMAPSSSVLVSTTRSSDTTAGFISGPAAAAPMPKAERDRRLAAAVAKYGERLVVREFIDDLKHEPCTAKVIADEKITDLVGTMSAARRAGCLGRLKLKYALRPQFIRLIEEVMSDPDLRPLLESFPEDTAAQGDISVKVSTGLQPQSSTAQ